MRAVKSVHASRNMGDTLFPSILPVLRQFWRIEGMFKAADGSLLRSGYVEMNLKLQLVLPRLLYALAAQVLGGQVFNPKPTEKEALAAAAWDWANDRFLVSASLRHCAHSLDCAAWGSYQSVFKPSRTLSWRCCSYTAHTTLRSFKARSLPLRVALLCGTGYLM